MNKAAEIINQLIQTKFNQQVEVSLTRPKPEFGDFSTNIAMQLAGKLGQNPRQIAEELKSELENNDFFESVEIAGPGFINFRVSAGKLEETLSQAFNEKYGSNNSGEGKTVIVEYPSPNFAKPYSVGHLRPGNQGWATRQLLDFTGWNVITDNHIGDYGTPFGIWVAGFLAFSSEEKLAERGIYELGDVYSIAEWEKSDINKAKQWKFVAADHGHAIAMNKLGNIYWNENDYSKANEWYRKAGEAGFDWGWRNLARDYHDGKGVEKDIQKAIQLFEKAYEMSGEAAGNSANQIGLIYWNENDYSKANEWHQKAGEAGYDWGWNNLALSYRNGDGVEKDIQKAIQLFEKAYGMSGEAAKKSAEWLMNIYNNELYDSGKAQEWKNKWIEQGGNA